MDRQAQRDIRRKLNCLQFAQECGSVVLTYLEALRRRGSPLLDQLGAVAESA